MPDGRWSLRPAWPYLLVAAVVIVLDQITKLVVLERFSPASACRSSPASST